MQSSLFHYLTFIIKKIFQNKNIFKIKNIIVITFVCICIIKKEKTKLDLV